MNDNFWMFRALLVAKKSFFINELPVGSILVYNDFELSFALNCFLGYHYFHSEINIFRKASFYFSANIFDKSVLYVTLQPCFNCLSILFYYKISKIVFGSYSFFYDNFFITKNILGGILENECTYLLKNFFDKKRI